MTLETSITIPCRVRMQGEMKGMFIPLATGILRGADTIHQTCIARRQIASHLALANQRGGEGSRSNYYIQGNETTGYCLLQIYLYTMATIATEVIPLFSRCHTMSSDRQVMAADKWLQYNDNHHQPLQDMHSNIWNHSNTPTHMLALIVHTCCNCLPYPCCTYVHNYGDQVLPIAINCSM